MDALDEIRRWLLRLLVGKRTVVMNAKIEHGVLVLDTGISGSYINNCHIIMSSSEQDCAIAIERGTSGAYVSNFRVDNDDAELSTPDVPLWPPKRWATQGED